MLENERLSRLLFYGYVLLLTYLVFLVLQPFLMPLAWAGVLALCFWPLFNRLQPRLGTTGAALLVTGIASLLLLAPVVWVIWSLVEQLTGATAALQVALHRIENMERLQQFWALAQAHAPLPSLAQIESQATAQLAQASANLTGQTAGILQNAAVFAMKTTIVFLALFFFLLDGHRMHTLLRRLLPFSPMQQERLMTQTRDLIAAGIRATLLIALLQGTTGGILFACLGIDSPVFWGLLMIFCALIPVVGSSLIWIPAAIVLLAGGHWIRGAILLLGGVVIISMIDTILRPLLLRGKTRTNGLLTLLSVLGGVATFGFLGLILGPVVLAAMQSLTALLPEPDAAPAETPK